MVSSFIEQSLALYRQQVQIGNEIEHTLQSGQFGHLAAQTQYLHELQMAAQESDGMLLASIGNDVSPSHNGLHELLDLMGTVQQHHARLLPQLQGIMALHRDELNKMRRGNTMLQGYSSPTRTTGKRISSTG